MSQMCLCVCEPTLIPLYTTEWPFHQRLCYNPIKADFILGHPVERIKFTHLKYSYQNPVSILLIFVIIVIK